jgi:LmbE family N-acetylglucosaminyl deacetylase
MRIMVIAAHPDDEVLGVGGTIARYSKEHDVYTLIVTDGSSTQYAGTKLDLLAGKKREETLKCKDILGIKDVFFGNLPDMKLDTVAHVEINSLFIKYINKIKPDWIFTHHWGDVNMDHSKVFESTMVAVRPTGGRFIKRVATFETPSATEWNGYDRRSAFVPNWYVRIDEQLQVKLDALRCYETEQRPYPHPRSSEAVIAQAGMRGLAAGMAAAEAFCIVREFDI